MGHLTGLKIIQPYEVDLEEAFDRNLSYAADFAGIMGQEHVKRAMEVAAAGGHNALTFGTTERRTLISSKNNVHAYIYQEGSEGMLRGSNRYRKKKGEIMKKTTVIIALLLIALLAIAGTVAAQPLNFRAHMTAAPGVDSQGQGQANFRLDHDELNFIMPLSKLNGDTLAAHIHISAEPGGNGPPVISLCGLFGPPPIPVGDCGGPGNPAKGSIALSETQIENLMTAIAENRAYVNVHTTDVPPGEIRGQITISP